MKQRLISVMLACLMVFTVLPMMVSAADRDVEIVFSTEDSDGKVGSTVQIEVSIKNNPGFVSTTIPVLWNSSELELVGVLEENRDLVENGLLKKGSNPQGMENCGWIGYEITDAVNELGLYHLAWNYDTMYTGNYKELNFTEDGLLCVMEFKVLKEMAKDATYTISADTENSFINMMNWDMEDIVKEEVSGVSIQFINGEVKMSEVAGTYILGDVNNDNVVNTSDARYILRYVVKYVDEGIEIWKGDVNNDGVINTSDARYILRYVVKYNDNLGIGEERPIKN